MAFVYWIHLPEHTDMFTEGYIGFTSKTVEERYKGHLKESRSSRCPNYPIYNNIKKYGDKLIVSTIVEADTDYCLYIEEKLRPDFKIGWNLQIGGNKGGYGRIMSPEARKKISDHVKSRVVSEETRKRMSIAFTGRVMPKDYCIRMSESKKGIPRPKESLEKRKETITRNPWLNARKNKCTWAEADKLFSIYQEHSGNFSSYYHFGQVCGKSETQVKNIFKLLKSGWVPHLDDNFTQWLTSYKANNGKK